MRSHLPLVFGLLAAATLSAAQTPSRESMRELRKAALTQTAAHWKFKRAKAFPSVFGIVVDFPIGDQTATLFCMKDGSTSLYTTSSFGVIGGKAHPTVRKAALVLTALAGSFWSEGKPTQSASYPANGRVRFSMLGYDGNRVVESTLPSVNRRQDRLYPLWTAVNRVLTELRTVADAADRR